MDEISSLSKEESHRSRSNFSKQSGFRSFLSIVQFLFYMLGLPVGLLFSVKTSEVKKIKTFGAIILAVILASRLGIAVQLVGAAVFLAIAL